MTVESFLPMFLERNVGSLGFEEDLGQGLEDSMFFSFPREFYIIPDLTSLVEKDLILLTVSFAL